MVVIAKEKDMSHFDMYEAANVRYIVRHEALPSWNAWFAEAEAKGKKSKM